MPQVQQDIPNDLTTKQIWLIFLGVIFLWFATPFVTGFFTKDFAEKGQAGDLFGSVNALFSGLAFAGVAIAILLQRRELALQRQVLLLQKEELELTRRELARSAVAQDETQKALNKSIYAQTFKVAMDIFDSDISIKAREILVTKMSPVRNDSLKWDDEMKKSADVMVRVFEQICTFVKIGSVPADYVIQTWAVHIRRYWLILEHYINHVRDVRGNVRTAVQFQELNKRCIDYLAEQGITVELPPIAHGQGA